MIRIGVDIGGTNVGMGLVEDGEIVAKCSERFSRAGGVEGCCDRIRAQAGELLAGNGRTFDEVEWIGAAVPGSVNREKGIVIDAYNLDFHDAPLRERLAERFGRYDIDVLNDADAAANAELHSGAMKGMRTAAFITLGTGVGFSLIIDGRIFEGGMGNGTEGGHMILRSNGYRCSCGARGCAETLCSAPALMIKARRVIKAHPDSALWRNRRKLNAKALFEFAKNGDELALRILDEYTDALSDYVASLMNLLDPEAVCIGGGISAAGEILFEPLRRKAYGKCFFRNHGKVIQAHYLNDAGIIGAASGVAKGR
ncbi:MAG: ROK family protein [Clostridia bacterium]|nr:ROK family protein [Clostridia bacterium]